MSERDMHTISFPQIWKTRRKPGMDLAMYDDAIAWFARPLFSTDFLGRLADYLLHEAPQDDESRAGYSALKDIIDYRDHLARVN